MKTTKPNSADNKCGNLHCLVTKVRQYNNNRKLAQLLDNISRINSYASLQCKYT